MQVMTLVYLFCAFVVGAGLAALLTYLLVDRRARSASIEAIAGRAIADQRAVDLSHRASQLEANLKAAADERSKLESARATLAAQLDAERQKNVEHLKALEDRAQFVASTEAHLKDAFARVSSETLQVGNKQLLELAATRFAELTTRATGSLEEKKLEMQNLLQPVQQQLVAYRESLEKLEKSRVDAYGQLTTKLADVAKTQELVGTEARQLSNALRKSQVRGNWGELTLRRLLEMSGLADRVSFSEQVNVDTEEGRQRPDCVVRLPNDRDVLIDSKAVLDAFLDGVNCADDVSRVECFKRHAKQVRAKVDDLSRKAYWDSFGKSAEYVVLFLPGESFLYAAVEHDDGLIEYALASKVIIASPTTLLGLLKVIEYGWEKKNVEDNAREIQQLAADLYGRVATMQEKFLKLGNSLEGAAKAYNDTLGSLEGRVFSKARDMAELGVTNPKEVVTIEPLPTHVRELGKQWAGLPGALEKIDDL